MSRRTPRNNLSVSLFPFLAVLVCAMGALIFLLIVTTQMIGDESAQKLAAKVSLPEPPPEAPPSPFLDVEPYESPDNETLDAAPEFVIVVPKPEPLPAPKIVSAPPPDPNIELRRQIATLEQEKSRRQSQLAEKTADLLAAEKARAAAELDLQNKQKMLDDLRAEQQHLQEQDDEHVSQRKKLLLKIRKTEDELEKLQKRMATAPSKYALIPYDGRQGTTRRPIFVECTEKGIRFLPENVFLGPSQLEGFSDSVNPLLAGVQALNDYWTEQARNSGSESQEKPYLLLIVRPEGSITYYLARKFLTEWKDSYGYELVEEDFPWQLPDADPQAQQVLRQAIAESMKIRRDVIRKYTVRGSLDQLSEFPDREEITDTELPFSHGTSTASRFAEQARQHRRRIASSNQSGSDGSTATGRGTSSQPALPGWDTVPPHDGRGQSRMPPENNGTEGDVATGNPAGRNDGFGDVPRRFVSPTEAAELGLGHSLAENSPGHQGSGASPLESDPFQAAGRRGASRLENESPSGHTQTPNPLDDAVLGNSDQNGQTVGSDGEAGRTADAGTASKSGTSESTLADQKQGQGGGKNAGPTQNELAKTPFTGRTTATPAPTDQQTSESPSQLGGTSSPSVIGQQQQPPTLPMLTFERQQQMDQMKRNLSKRGWGLSRRTGIGIERSVNVVITADRIHVGDLETAIVLGQGETEQQVLRAVIVDMDEYAKEWGNPPSGFYWVPMVRFRVHPEAMTVVKPIERALREGGLSTKIVYLQAEAGNKQEVSR